MEKEPELNLPTAVGTGGKTGWVKCPVCGEVVTDQGRGAHFRNSHPDMPYDEYKAKFERLHSSQLQSRLGPDRRRLNRKRGRAYTRAR